MEPYTPEVMDSFTVSVNLVMTNEAGHTFYPERNYVGGLDAVTARSGAKPQYFFERPQPGSSVFRVVCHYLGVRARGRICCYPPRTGFAVREANTPTIFFILLFPGAGRTKKIAKQAAAKLLYRHLTREPDVEMFNCPTF